MKIQVNFGATFVGEFRDMQGAHKGMWDYISEVTYNDNPDKTFRMVFMGEGNDGPTFYDEYSFFSKSDRQLLKPIYSFTLVYLP